MGCVGVNNASVTEPTLVYILVTYTVAFSETGLPSGLSWQVAVNGVTRSLITNGLTDSLLWTGATNGSYPYSITDIPSWHQTTLAYSGSIVVNGGTGPIDGTGVGYAVTLVYSQISYTVTMSESSLPPGLTWQVTVNGLPEQTRTTGGPVTLTWSGLQNGTYSYLISDISGWHQTTLPYSGSVTVNGQSVTEPSLAYTLVTYSVVFAESGLPSGLTFQVTVNLVSWSLTTDGGTDSHTFPAEPNGTYAYSIADIPGWNQATLNSSGSILVSGGTGPINGTGTGYAVTLAYSQFTYSLTFTETGLPTGTLWFANLTEFVNATYSRQLSLNSTGGTIVFRYMPNGTYSFSVATTDKAYAWVAGGNASFTVNGTSINRQATFNLLVYALDFIETGFPLGGRANWSIVLGGRLANSTTDTISFAEPNGTYSFTLGPVVGFTSTPRLGSVTVSGPVRPLAVTFKSTLPPPTGQPGSVPFQPIDLLAGLLVAVAIGTAAVRVHRRGKTPPKVVWPPSALDQQTRPPHDS